VHAASLLRSSPADSMHNIIVCCLHLCICSYLSLRYLSLRTVLHGLLTNMRQHSLTCAVLPRPPLLHCRLTTQVLR
jgi:hypothetical protein